MINKIHFIKYAILALCVICVAEISLAKDGDKGKGKSEKGDKSDATKQDSISGNIGIDAAQQDDTLVFEDWERPSDGGTGGGSAILLLDENSDLLAIGTSKVSFTKSQCEAKCSGYKFNDTPQQTKIEHAVDFKLYPNPAVSQLHLSPSIIPSSLRIADITGKEHLSVPYSSTVEVSHLPTGTYFIQLIYADHIESAKFIKD